MEDLCLDLCRCCLSGSESILHDLYYFDEESNSRYYDKYKNLTHLEIIQRNDEKHFICSSCIRKLKEATLFFEQCLCSDDELKQRSARFSQEAKKVAAKRSTKANETSDYTLPNTRSKRSNKSVLKQEPDASYKTLFEEEELEDQVTFEEDENAGSDFIDEEDSDVPMSEILKQTKSSVKVAESLQPNVFQCDVCFKVYNSKSGLQNHLNSHKPNQKVKENSNKYLCSICGRSFSTSQRLKIHSFTHSGLKDFKCKYINCEKRFATEFRLKSHTRTHTGERPYTCEICQMSFAQGNALKCHRRTHTGDRPYECKKCLKRFSQLTILKTHSTIHDGKKVPCDYPGCEKKFSRPSYLILHRREHTGEKPYACDQCENRYKQKSHLDRHLDTHAGVRHVCSFPNCGKEYTKKWSLKMHQFSHDTKKPYSCTYCELSFIRKDKLKSHITKNHPEVASTKQPKIEENNLNESLEIIYSPEGEIQLNAVKFIGNSTTEVVMMDPNTSHYSIGTLITLENFDSSEIHTINQ